MSERGGRGGSSRGGPRGGGGGRGNHSNARGGSRGGGGGGAGGRGGGASGGGQQQERKKEVILDLAKFVDKKIRVKFQGGREVQGVLKGYDQLMNLVMDEVTEYLPSDGSGSEQKTRQLGLAVLRGTAVTIINPADGFEQIANPFVSAE
ncbi:U6 snRNA-associated Sm-like protein LSm7 [Microstroma glucosiphilum]|uniref:U6 snRNA-associated Sm-like protein LSm7 n=1 Tax=Pseudomicrostroma glucosiphilum TaxID=1684307 RepID=A0A316TZD5_9BASI|nr:U6 snRNA-associated Sm-like protein LSm7 [Pseudomicrostroma glucosiphilum]PWN18350.1 U6 snRNA-associated Sm-like protein LSm7 [Pseudomicrostroma glucosiphilum]